MATEPRIGAHEVRSRFLSFFESREHTAVPSSPLVPANDPTLLFTNAGMVQFKDVFTGRESRPYSRATSSQRCLRAGGKHNDLDNVGFTPRHHTFFEMLGNFSFGDYFKPEAIKWAWEFLTGELGIAPDKLVVSVFDGTGEDAPFDEEAYELWAEIIPRDRIYKCPAKENFWQMGDTGPCGPCSEIHLFRPDGIAPPHAMEDGPWGPQFQDDVYLELWNLVFMQYEKHGDGSMTALPKPSIDTGAGLERVAAVLAGAESNYGTELLAPLVERAKGLAGVRGHQGDKESPFQVIADHARATAFLISDGVFPDKTGRSYVLRRIMRRAIRYGTTVGLDKPFFHEVCAEVIDRFEHVYPELRRAAAAITEVVKTEETAFRRTLDRGLRRLGGELDALDAGAKSFPVSVAAELYDTFGFPIDLTAVIAREHSLELDEDEAEAEVHRRQSHAQKFAGEGEAVSDVYFAVDQAIASRGVPAFTGYDIDREEAVLWAIVRDGAIVDSAGSGDDVALVFSSTPMYAESGGQVGDRGVVEGEGAKVRIDDVRKPTGASHVHHGHVESGRIAVGDRLTVHVDVERRDAIRRNHSATHLLHHALREVLGEHVIQKGSLVAPDRLRFDFSHGSGLTSAQRHEIEERVNREVLANAASETREMQLESAKAAGAIGLFGEKYDDEVRVVSIGRESVELCGGTHVHRAGDIGSLIIVSEGGIAQGVRRIEAVTGMGALGHAQALADVVADASAALHAGQLDDVMQRLTKLQRDHKERAAEIADLKRQLATGGTAEQDAVAEVAGVNLLVKRVGAADPKTMRAAADTLRDRIQSGVIVLGAERDGKANLLVAVTKDLVPRVHAGKLAGALATAVDGRGGGRPELAQAGGSNVAALDDALASVPELLAAQLSESD